MPYTIASRVLHPTSWLLRLVPMLVLMLVLAACGGSSSPDSSSANPNAGVVGKSVVQSTADVYRFAKISNGAYFFTGNAGEKDIIFASYPDFRYEGVGFQRLASGSGGVPVYRFANLSNYGYFYTASAWERDWVIQNRPDMRFEGTTFDVVDAQTPGALPVMRLANLQNGAYLYTTSQAEADAAVASGRWRNEGIAFHAPPPTSATGAGGACEAGFQFDNAQSRCVPVCPAGSTLIGGVCTTPGISCPAGTSAVNGACVCTDATQIYDTFSKSCRAPCPAGSLLYQGQCACTTSGYEFDTASNSCYRPPTCPAGSTRQGPTCLCPNNGSFDATTNACLPACPSGASRVSGACICANNGFLDPSTNTCAPACPSDATRIGSTCVCNVSGFLYEAATNTCRLPTTETEFQVLSGRPSGCAENQDGCGGGADGSSGAAGDGSGASGADGQLSNAVVEVWRPNNGSLKLLGTVPVGPLSGMITLRPGTYTGPLLLTFKGTSTGNYFDEARRATRSFGASDELNVMIPSMAVAKRNYGATALTDAAFRYALNRWGSPSATREQNIAAILTPERIVEAHNVVLLAINEQLNKLNSSLQLTDLKKMPQVLGANTPTRSLPNTSNGVYAIVLAALSQSALNFSGVASPGREFARQFALDMSDGGLNGRAGDSSLPGTRVYATASDPTELGPKLPDTMVSAVNTVANVFASAALAQTVLRPLACGNITLVNSDGSYSCCPPGTLTTVNSTYFCRGTDNTLTTPIRYWSPTTPISPPQ